MIESNRDRHLACKLNSLNQSARLLGLRWGELTAGKPSCEGSNNITTVPPAYEESHRIPMQRNESGGSSEEAGVIPHGTVRSDKGRESARESDHCESSIEAHQRPRADFSAYVRPVVSVSRSEQTDSLFVHGRDILLRVEGDSKSRLDRVLPTQQVASDDAAYDPYARPTAILGFLEQAVPAAGAIWMEHWSTTAS